MNAPSASAGLDIDAPAGAVWALVTHLPTLALLADETTEMRWRSGDAARPGAVFTGRNSNGRRRWSTSCTVTDAVPARTFAFEVHHSALRIPVARWQYDVSALGSERCRVTESTWDRRPAWFRFPARLATGVRDRTNANAVHIENTLQRLKARAEAR